jgi:hypothetical protein
MKRAAQVVETSVHWGYHAEVGRKEHRKTELKDKRNK